LPYADDRSLTNQLQKRFDELAKQLEQVEATRRFERNELISGDFVDNDIFMGWSAKAKTLLVAAFGKESEHFKAFEKAEKVIIGTTNYTIMKKQKALFLAAKEDFEAGHLTGALNLGKNIVIGHGHSHQWMLLKDFLIDRLNLPFDEFNRISTAGVATANRLEQMLDNAAFAFLVLTAEDEQADGKFQSRPNVIHEAGLFQGRLGFQRAIVMLEEGCEEFSNIHGLGQLRFPKGNIKAEFEEVRRVLEREKVINPR
jgi:predicted nucleotide-binding protein